MMIAGFDISTSTVGRCVLDINDKGKCKVIFLDYYKPIKGTYEDKNKDQLHMLSEAKTSMLELVEKYKPDHIAVEDYIKFMSGGSGSSTIIPLATLNRTICLAFFENDLHTPIHICNVISIRTRIKKDSNRTDLPSKEEIPELLEKLLKIKIPRLMKKTRKGEKQMEEVSDMADAIAVAYYAYRKMQEDKK